MFRAYRYRNIIQHDIEPCRSSDHIISHQSTNILSLRDQLACVELRHHALQDLVYDARQHSFIVVCPQRPIYLRQGLYSRARQDTTGDVNHLKIFGARQGGDVARSGAHVVGDGCLEPRYSEMCSFVVDFCAYACESGVFDCAMTTVNYTFSLMTSTCLAVEDDVCVPLKRALLNAHAPPTSKSIAPALPIAPRGAGAPPPAPPNLDTG